MSVVYRAEAVIEWHIPEKSTHVFVHTHGRVDPDCGETVGTIKVRVESDEDVADDLLRLTVGRLRGALDAFLADSQPEEPT